MGRPFNLPYIEATRPGGITPTEWGTVMSHHVRTRTIAAVAGLAIALIAQGSAVASTSLTISGSSNSAVQKPRLVRCSIAGECGTIVLDGLGVADWGYVFGPTFEPVGRCFHEDGTFTITLRSDGSTISGPLTGTFCPDSSSANQGQDNSYGNPFSESATAALSGGSGQFTGLAGDLTYQVFSAGARTRVTLQGTLTD